MYVPVMLLRSFQVLKYIATFSLLIFGQIAGLPEFWSSLKIN